MHVNNKYLCARTVVTHLLSYLLHGAQLTPETQVGPTCTCSGIYFKTLFKVHMIEIE